LHLCLQRGDVDGFPTFEEDALRFAEPERSRRLAEIAIVKDQARAFATLIAEELAKNASPSKRVIMLKEAYARAARGEAHQPRKSNQAAGSQ